ncbi:hypothetical protein CR513_28870, partial [Mucuna pruriens]
MDKSMIDAASGGALMDKTPVFGIKGPSQSRMVNEIGATFNLRLENQLFELTYLVSQLVVLQHQPNMAAKVCGICTSVEHPTDLCPTLQEIESDQPKNVGAIGGYQYGKQPYQNQPFDNQQYGRQPFRSRLNQWPYAAQRFRPIPNVPQGSIGYQQPSLQYQALPSNNSSNRECHLKAILHLWRT